MVRRRTDRIARVARRRYWREADARAVVTAWQRSGKDLSSFAADHGLLARRISRWAARLEARSGGTVGFHPVQVVEGGRAGERREARERRDAIEVVLVDGRRVRVPAGFAAEDLGRVLSVLDGPASC